MRLIDADELIEYLNNLKPRAYDKEEMFVSLMKRIKRIPEAVVRCKDCVYWNRNDFIPGRDIARCDWFSILEDESNKKFEYTDADDFCSNGEREDES